MTVRWFPSVRSRISFIWKSIEDVSDRYQAVSGGLCEKFRLDQKRRCGVHAVIVGIPSCRGRCIVTIIGDIPINGLSPFETLNHSIKEPLVSWAVMDELSMIDRKYYPPEP